MRMLSPQAWSADPDAYEAMRGEDHRSDGWVVHWPGDGHVFDGGRAETVARLRSYEAYHRAKGWRGIAYDYAVDLEGRVWRLRGTGRSGATSGDFDEDGVPNNAETDAVLLLVGPGQPVSAPMGQATGRLLTWSARDYTIGHREARGTDTACPGPDVMGWLHRWRTRPTSAEGIDMDHLIAIVVTSDVDDGAARTLKARLDGLLGLPVPVLRHPAGQVGHAILVGAAARHAGTYPSSTVVTGDTRDDTGRAIVDLIC